MNWLGWSTRAALGAMLGALAGALAYRAALLHGVDAPYLVGMLLGLGAWLASPDRSGMRGLLLAVTSLWIAWAVQATWGPFASARLVRFHETLGWTRWLAFGACGVAAFVLARGSARPDAARRASGA